MKLSEFEPQDREKLASLGVSSLLDLALILPISYDDTYICSSPFINSQNVLHVKILSTRRTPKVFQMRLWCELWGCELDGVVFAPKPYHEKIFKKGSDLHVKGRVEFNGASMQVVQPRVIASINTITPKYKTSLHVKSVMTLMHKYISVSRLIDEGLSAKEAETLVLFHQPTHIFSMQFSSTGYTQEQLRVLKFVEIFSHLKKLSSKKIRHPSTARLYGDERAFVNSLPFRLTKDQTQAIADIKKDLSSDIATKRMIMGDVGCGKTMVILASVMMAYPHKSVLMAPTTVLASQLFEEAKKFLPLHVKIKLLLQDTPKKESFEDVDFVIGTHALMYRELPHFDLVMVDEQHRFGTQQRSFISSMAKKEHKHPHFLQFSATPIPRTLSMIQSSLIDFSFIKELPFEKKIDTCIIGKSNFKELLEHIQKEVSHKRQCIVVYPLVEESKAVNYQSIDEGRGFWEKNFKDVYVTYGKDKNKEAILQEFKEKGSILISTTVVEVGISLPNLSTIVIVGAERLGLATLHQLRGRVSRNGLKGYCFLYTNLSKSERLEEFSKTLDGFEIAELDLRYRQGGDMISGTAQSGKEFVWFEMEEDIAKEAKRRVEERTPPR
ncbi:MAG: ATP-dependent DNA helicase RecG [Sulfurospirillaceae bacterium]|nr:ATP-dependent DNA helicase RecG [Sulfurospirillaceae bacterium]